MDPFELLVEKSINGSRIASAEFMYAYLIRSQNSPDQTYVGISTDLMSEIKLHNEGRIEATKKYVPWEVCVAVRFSNLEEAQEFEKILRTEASEVATKNVE